MFELSTDSLFIFPFIVNRHVPNRYPISCVTALEKRTVSIQFMTCEAVQSDNLWVEESTSNNSSVLEVRSVRVRTRPCYRKRYRREYIRYNSVAKTAYVCNKALFRSSGLYSCGYCHSAYKYDCNSVVFCSCSNHSRDCKCSERCRRRIFLFVATLI